MTRGISAALALVLLLLAPAGARAQLVDGVAAIVDKEIILLSEVELAARVVVERLEQRQSQRLPPEMVRGIYKDALQSLIDAKLIEAFATRANLAADDAEIDRAVASIAQEEGVTPEDVYGAATAQGLTREGYRRELGRQITRMKVISGSVRSRVTVSDAEVQEVFEERYGSQEPGLRVRVRHIFVPWPDSGGENDRAQMRDVAEKIREAAIESGQFAALARQYSRAPTAADGGLTTFKKGEVAPEIADAVFTLPPGEITPVLETEHGLNVFQIVNRFDPAEVELADVEDALRAELLERKTMPEFESWVKELRENRYIEVVNDQLR